MADGKDPMRIALDEARAAGARGEVPVGAALVREGIVLAKAGNSTLADDDPTAHDLIGDMLAKEGYRVLHTTSGRDALDIARREQPDAITPALEKMLEDVLLNAFLDLFSHASDEVRGRRGNFAVSAYLVKRCQELAGDSGDTSLSILDLCEQLRVSRRTLQNSFQAVTGMRPVEYLRNLRLNAVRRRLITTQATAQNVGEIAVAMGFFHLSHFATHYRALFGESPSETPRAK